MNIGNKIFYSPLIEGVLKAFSEDFKLTHRFDNVPFSKSSVNTATIFFNRLLDSCDSGIYFKIAGYKGQDQTLENRILICRFILKKGDLYQIINYYEGYLYPYNKIIKSMLNPDSFMSYTAALQECTKLGKDYKWYTWAKYEVGCLKTLRSGELFKSS